MIINPSSRKDGDKWIPEGMIGFPSGPDLTERKEWCEDAKFDSKGEADQYFMQASKRKYKIVD